jgi:hypothetical protein
MSNTPTLDKYLGTPEMRELANAEHRRWLKGLDAPLKVAERVSEAVVKAAVKAAKDLGQPFSSWGPMYADRPTIVHEVMTAWNPRERLLCCACLRDVSPDCRIEPCPMCRLRIARCSTCKPKTLPTTIRAHLRHMHGTVAPELPDDNPPKD